VGKWRWTEVALSSTKKLSHDQPKANWWSELINPARFGPKLYIHCTTVSGLIMHALGVLLRPLPRLLMLISSPPAASVIQLKIICVGWKVFFSLSFWYPERRSKDGKVSIFLLLPPPFFLCVLRMREFRSRVGLRSSLTFNGIIQCFIRAMLLNSKEAEEDSDENLLRSTFFRRFREYFPSLCRHSQGISSSTRLDSPHKTLFY
jgi:hypothetical protein